MIVDQSDSFGETVPNVLLTDRESMPCHDYIPRILNFYSVIFAMHILFRAAEH